MTASVTSKTATPILPGTSKGMLAAESEEAALELLHELGCTDGLPCIVPTKERVDRFVLASGLDAELELGLMGPEMGSATVEKISTAAVMAGCIPDAMPVIVAAVQAVMDEKFDLTEMQATTHCTAPLLLINGPVRHWLDIQSGFGALGPGFRANATIGRALRLAMINIGGGRAGESDMALLGHPGKFTYCLAEAEEESPFEPLHTSLGFDAEDCVVTVIGAEPPHSVIQVVDADDPSSCDRLLESLGAALSNVATNNAILRGGAAVVVLNPEHANVLAASGFDRVRIQNALFERCNNSRETIERLVPSFAARSDESGPVACFKRPEDILVLVAGGGGLYSVVMPSWCAGPHCNTASSRLIEMAEFCELPP